MTSIQEFKITPLAPASVNVPRMRIDGQVFDSDTGAMIADLTGSNAIMFPEGD